MCRVENNVWFLEGSSRDRTERFEVDSGSTKEARQPNSAATEITVEIEGIVCCGMDFFKSCKDGDFSGENCVSFSFSGIMEGMATTRMWSTCAVTHLWTIKESRNERYMGSVEVHACTDCEMLQEAVKQGEEAAGEERLAHLRSRWNLAPMTLRMGAVRAAVPGIE